MRIGICFWMILMVLGCNSENGSDCFKKQGQLINQQIAVDSFSKITISEGIELVVSESVEQKVELRAGKNFVNDIHFEVIEGELKISNQSGCGMLRNYHAAQIFITTPFLEKIYSSSQYSIKSEGVLTFPILTLESGITTDTASSIFEIEVDNEKLIINDNVSSVYRVKGQTDKLEVHFWGANGRLEAEDLVADQISIFHRSTNDMLVFPVNKINGKLMSTGNLILKNVPPTVDVEQLYTGHIVYP